MSIKIFFSLVTFLLFFAACGQTNEQLLENAYILIKQKNYDDAIKVYSKVIKSNNKLQLAYYNRGYTYLAKKEYHKALKDFNKIIDLQTRGNYIITYNQDSPFAGEEARTQIPYNDALYQRAQVKYYMDTLESSLNDFQILIDNNYEKSNCLVWQGTIYVRTGKVDKACTYFTKSNEVALTDDDRNEATRMLETYCEHTINNR